MMTKMNTINTDLFRSRVDIIILSTLSDKDRYGYEILEVIVQNSVSHYEIKQSTLYSILKRLDSLEYISSYDGIETHGAQRKYYTLTDKGRSYLEAQQYEWEYTRTLLDKLVSDKPVDLINALSPPPYNPKDLKPMTPRRQTEQTQEDEGFNQTNNLNSDLRSLTDEKTESPTRLELVDQEVSVKEKLERERAERILGLGVYLPLETTNLTNSNNNEVNKHATLASIGTDIDETSDSTLDINYREALGSLYTNTSTSGEEIVCEANEEVMYIKAENMRYPHYNDMKQRLFDDGYTVKTYNKANSTNFYYMNYYYSNKLFRDLSITIYVFYASLILLLKLVPINSLELSTLSVFILLITGFLVPIVRLLIYFKNPLKRIRAKFDPLKISIGCIIWITIAICIIFIFNVINDALYITFVLYLSVPFKIIIYYLLFRSNKYHLKK
ncbi:MAG: PadR family transcriptional regulator [Christensenellales bacterium]